MNADNDNQQSIQSGDTPFDQPFPQPSREQWVELAVAGIATQKTQLEALDALRRTTLDGIAIDVLYDSAKQGFGASQLHSRQIRSNDAWDNRFSVDTADPDAAHLQIIRALNGGVTSIELIVHDPASISVSLQTVKLSMVSISLRAATDHSRCLQALQELAASQGIEPGALCCSVNADPVGALLRQTTAASNAATDATTDVSSVIDRASLAEALTHMASLARVSADTLPRSTSILVDAAVHHNAGASCVEELHAALATATVYLETLLKHGLNASDACRQIVFQVAMDADLLVGVAKLRALRALWQYTAQQISGLTDTALPCTVVAETSTRFLSKMQPWNNHLRNLSASTAALLGGADTLIVHPHDALERATGHVESAKAKTSATELSDRIARNMAIILERECGLGKVSDPLAGSYAIENLTQQLMQHTWQSLSITDTSEGWLDELFTGRWQMRLADTHRRRISLLKSQEQIVVGVNRFVQEDEIQHAQPDAQSQLKAPALTLVRDAESFEIHSEIQNETLSEALKQEPSGQQQQQQQQQQEKYPSQRVAKP